MTITDEDREALNLLLDTMKWDEVEKIVGLPAFMHVHAQCYRCEPDVPTSFYHGNYWGLAGRCMSSYDSGVVKQSERALELARLLKSRGLLRKRPSDTEANAALYRLTKWVNGEDPADTVS